MSNIATYAYQDPNIATYAYQDPHVRKPPRTFLVRVHRKGAAPSHDYGVGGLNWWMQRPSLKGGGTVLLRYDSWNLCVRSFGEPSPKSPIRGGGSMGNRLEGPPHPELQWIPGPSITTPVVVVRNAIVLMRPDGRPLPRVCAAPLGAPPAWCCTARRSSSIVGWKASSGPVRRGGRARSSAAMRVHWTQHVPTEFWWCKGWIF